MPISFFSSNNMTLPPEGPKVIPFNLDMALEQIHEIDLSELTEQGYISFVSGIYFDNADNTQDVTILCNATNQRVIVPASVQMWAPLLITNPAKFNISQSSAGDLVRAFFVNYPVFPWISPAL